MKELGGNGVCLDLFGSIGQSTDNRVIISSFRSFSIYPVPLQTQQQKASFSHSEQFCLYTFIDQKLLSRTDKILCFNVLQQNVVFQHFAKCSLNSTGRPNMCIIF